MEIPAGIAAEAALTRQAVSLSVMKQASDMDKMLAAILDKAASNVPASAVRGTNVNISA
jgi:hypothetical protein